MITRRAVHSLRPGRFIRSRFQGCLVCRSSVHGRTPVLQRCLHAPKDECTPPAMESSFVKEEHTAHTRTEADGIESETSQAAMPRPRRRSRRRRQRRHRHDCLRRDVFHVALNMERVVGPSRHASSSK